MLPLSPNVSTDSIDCLTRSRKTWPNQAKDQCIPKSLEFLSFHEPLGIIIWAFSAFGACAALAVIGVFVMYRKTPVIWRHNIELSFLLLLFLCACFLIGQTFIGKLTDWLCQIRYPAFGKSFTLYFMHLGKNCCSFNGFQSHPPWQYCHEVVWPC